MEITIREATQTDAASVHRVLLEAFKEYKDFYSKEAFNDTVLSGSKAKERIRETNVYIAVDRNGQVVGTIGWVKRSNEEGHIRGMAVHPQYQGEGTADRLLSFVEKSAKDENCKYLSLDTTEILQRAQNFYKKRGFERTGKTSDFFGNKIHEFVKKLG